jgi:hypothetical protein
MKDESFYKPYRTAEGRALYLVAMKRYGSLIELGKVFKVNRQAVSNYIADGLPYKYAGYLGRKFGFSPYILDYKSYLIGHLYAPHRYDELFENQDYFNQDDINYILDGEYIKDGAKWIRAFDKEQTK